MNEPTLSKYNPFAIDAEDPYPAYARFRAAGPLLRAGPGIWVIPRYQEVSDLLRDSRLGGFRFRTTHKLSSPRDELLQHDNSPASSFLQSIVVASDGQTHLRLRKVLGQVLKPTDPSARRRSISGCIDRLLAGLAQGANLDIVSHLALPLPLAVLGAQFGLPVEDRREIALRVLKLSKLFAPEISSEIRAAADEAVVWLRAYVGAMLVERRKVPADDVLTNLADAERSGLLSLQEAIDNAVFLIFAGLETSMNLISAGCVALSQHPEQMTRLRTNPSLTPTAVDEFLRFDPPTQITARTVLKRIEIADRTLSKGRVLLLLLASANRDEKQFENPDQLDVGREPNPHLSFGAGAHLCLGSNLARIQAEILFQKLSRWFLLEPDGEVVKDSTVTPRIYAQVPLKVTRIAGPPDALTSASDGQ